MTRGASARGATAGPSGCRSTPTSRPDENDLPSPRQITARTSGRALSSARISNSAASISSSNALCLSGLVVGDDRDRPVDRQPHPVRHLLGSPRPRRDPTPGCGADRNQVVSGAVRAVDRDGDQRERDRGDEDREVVRSPRSGPRRRSRHRGTRALTIAEDPQHPELTEPASGADELAERLAEADEHPGRERRRHRHPVDRAARRRSASPSRASPRRCRGSAGTPSGRLAPDAEARRARSPRRPRAGPSPTPSRRRRARPTPPPEPDDERRQRAARRCTCSTATSGGQTLGPSRPGRSRARRGRCCPTGTRRTSPSAGRGSARRDSRRPPPAPRPAASGPGNGVSGAGRQAAPPRRRTVS